MVMDFIKAKFVEAENEEIWYYVSFCNMHVNKNQAATAMLDCHQYRQKDLSSLQQPLLVVHSLCTVTIWFHVYW